MPETLRCGGCGIAVSEDEMFGHIRACDGWVSYEGDALAELALDAGFEVEAFADFRPAEKLTLRAKVRSIFRV